MYIDDHNNPLDEEIVLENGHKKIIRYHWPSGDSERKHEAICMTIYIYDKNNNLISEETKKNPNSDYIKNIPNWKDYFKEDLKKY